MINLIACVTTFKNRLAIGRNGDLLFKLKDDMKFFKNITKDALSQNSKLDKNVVLMGRKTWFSIPQKYRPLEGRVNLVLTNDRQLITPIPKNLDLTKSNSYFITMETFWKIYDKYTPNVFVIGGSNIYNYFLNRSEGAEALVDRIYLTDVKTENGNNVKFDKENEPDTFMDNPDSSFKLIGYSEKYYQDNLSYRILTYKNTNVISEEHHYLDLAKYILENGKERNDRTGTGTIGIFGAQLRFDISNGNLPLLTTKQVPLKAIVEELLFFCRGDTDAKILDKKGVKIWNGNTSSEFLDNRGLGHYPEGCMGPMYGFSWRHFGAKYSSSFGDTSKCDTSLIGGFDQLAHVEHLLKTDPFSRRIYISNLNPAESSKMCLDMCHTYIQFYVEEINGVKYLSGYFTMRSSDYFLAAVSFNLISYNLLINILALKCNMKPKEIVYNSVDCHIYKNHIEQVKEQLTRTPRPFPHIKLNDSLKDKDWSQMEFSDFELIGYMPWGSIKAPMAI
jgi:dihydrofolate reductase/thymidylate synthase